MPETLRHHEVDVKAQEACGFVGIISTDGSIVSPLVREMGIEQQHRGYDTAGMVSYRPDTGLVVHTGEGLISEVFPEGFDFEGKMLLSDRAWIHNRYGTSELNGVKDHILGAQPVVSKYGEREAAIVYNGNIPDGVRQTLRDKIPADLLREYSFDTQDINDALVSAPGETWHDNFKSTFEGVDGALSIGIMTGEGDMYGYRGVSGTWPLWVGEIGNKYILASETRVQIALGGEVKWREVAPGELVQITPEGIKSRQIFSPKPEVVAECSLHAMYNARPDSIMAIRPDGKAVTYRDFRKAIGAKLAEEHPFEADIYFGVPNTGLPIAEGYAKAMDKEVSNEAITLREIPNVKPGEYPRAYIQQNNGKAEDVVDGKYIAHRSFFKGKVVVAFDDSIIKGLTTRGNPENGKKGTVPLMKEAGAKEIHLMFGMPKFVEGCDMGVVIRKGSLIAMIRQKDGTYLELTAEQIAEKVGADSIQFLSLKGLREVYEEVTQKEGLCVACVGGGHPLERNRIVDIREPALVA